MSKEIIVSGDWHIRASTPISRKERNWWDDVLKPKIEFILSLGLPIYHTGDFFDRSNFSSLKVLNWMKQYKNSFTVIPGNHDISNYNWGNIKDSAFYNIFDHENLPSSFAIEGCIDEYSKNVDILFYHGWVTDKKEVPFYMDGKGLTAKDLLKKYPDPKIILTGDNHESFIYRKEDRIVINPGSLTRSTKTQKNYKPKVYELNIETLDVKTIYIPINDDVWMEEEDLEYEKLEFQSNIDSGLDFIEIVIKLSKEKNIPEKEIKKWALL